MEECSSFIFFLVNFWAQKHGASRDLGRSSWNLDVTDEARESRRQLAQGSSVVWWLLCVACCLVSWLSWGSSRLLKSTCLERPLQWLAFPPWAGCILVNAGLLCTQGSGNEHLTCWRMNSIFSTTQEWNTFHPGSKEKGTTVTEVLPSARVTCYLISYLFYTFALLTGYEHWEFGATQLIRKGREETELLIESVKLLAGSIWVHLGRTVA